MRRLLHWLNSEQMLAIAVVLFFVAVVTTLLSIALSNRGRIERLERPTPAEIRAEVDRALEACLEDRRCRAQIADAGRQLETRRRAEAQERQARARARARSTSPSSTAAPRGQSPTSQGVTRPDRTRTPPRRRPSSPASSPPPPSSPPAPSPTPAPRPEPVASLDVPLVPLSACLEQLLEVNCPG